MSSWLDNGRSVLLEAVKAAYDQLVQEARAELHARDQEKKDLLHDLHDRSFEVDHLRQENEQLKAEITRLRKFQPESSAPLKERVVLGALSSNRYIGSYNVASSKLTPENDYPKLVKRYRDLQASCERYRTRLRDALQANAEWSDHGDRQKEKIKQLRDKLKARGVTSEDVVDLGGVTSLQHSTSDPAPVRRPSPRSEFDHSSLLQVSSALVTTAGHSVSAVSTKRIRSESPLQQRPITPTNLDIDKHVCVGADDTELPPHLDFQDQDQLVTIKLEPSSDGPICISTREIRKRKNEMAEAEPRRLQKIKSEHSNSSGSEAVAEHHRSSAAESIDYEKEVHVPTPRKRKRKRKDLSRALRDEHNIDLESTPHDKRLNVQGSGMSHTSTPGSVSSSSGLDVVFDDGYQSSDVQRAESVSLWPPQSPSLRMGPKVRSHNPPRLDMGVMSLAEDGEDGLDSVSHAAVKGRLDTLLNPSSAYGLTPVKQRGLRKNDVPPVKEKNAYLDNSKLAPRRGLPFKKTKMDSTATGTPTMRSKSNDPSPQPSVVRQRGPYKPSILRDDMPRGRPPTREGTPLRERPIDRLQPEDFKPNPRYNDGLTYVFDEVVRGKEARAALSGCIDPSCCGKIFRHFAEAERKITGSSMSSQAENIKLLETYLGDEAWRLGTMSPDEKEETWLLAKTWELANKFGKHRQRYSRMPTPPGFWNMDFPSTQERAEEKIQAQEIRAALVHQRYREAMRPNGAWLFRDEKSN